MTVETKTVGASTPAIVPAPPGLTAIDADNKMLPIVALQVQGDGLSTVVTALYLCGQGEAVPVFPGAQIGLSRGRLLHG